MKNDDVLKQIKEVLDIVKSKVDKLEFFQDVTSEKVRFAKDQLSVINEKLDSHSASLISIESKLDAYGDMYKLIRII